MIYNGNAQEQNWASDLTESHCVNEKMIGVSIWRKQEGICVVTFIPELG